MLNIIIADDEEIISNNLKEVISAEFDDIDIIAVCNDGDAVISLLKKRRVDIVVSDIKMHRVSGLDVAKYVYENNLSTQIILISGYKEFDFARKALEYKVGTYILKPIVYEELFAEIRKIAELLSQKEIEENILTGFKMDFLKKLFDGKYKSIEEMKRVAVENGVAIDISSATIITANLYIEDFKDFLAEKFSDDEQEELKGNFVRNFFYRENKSYIFTPVEVVEDEVTIVGICGEGDENMFEVYVNDVNDFLFEFIGVRAQAPKAPERLLLEELAQRLLKRGEQSDNVVQKAREYIMQNYANDISLNDIAQHLYMHPAYFSSFFKRATGENFSSYLVKVRINIAIEMMRGNDYKIYEISEKVGYKSTAYFIKLFKKVTGFTPKEYQKNVER